MKHTTVYLVQLPDPVREMAMQAARGIFPRGHVQLVPVRTVAEAVRLPGQGRQLLVIGDVSEAEIGVASQVQDALELPRWAIVHLGVVPSDLVESVAVDDCTPGLLPRVFRAAVLHHELLRENLQLRGDLKTVARRFSHDIRTPLGCINTLCSLLQEPSAGARDPHDAVSAILTSTAEINTLLDRLSFVLKASSEPLPSLPVAMAPIVLRAISQLSAERSLPNVKVSQPTEWPEVRGVEPWLEFVWFTLLCNAARHGGRSRAIQVGWEPRGHDLRFWVASDGPVAPALQPNLLRPFHLLHQQASAGGVERDGVWPPRGRGAFWVK